MLLALLPALFAPFRAGAQSFAVKTNLLFDAAMTPDLGVELVTGEHTSVSLSVCGHYKPYGLQSKLWLVQPEFRYWFNGRPLVREYVGIAAFGASYDMSLGSYVHNGDALSLGLSGGYVLPLGKRLNIEFSAGFGFLLFKQKQYLKDDHYDDYNVNVEVSERTNAWGYKLFPAKLGVTLIYIIK